MLTQRVANLLKLVIPSFQSIKPSFQQVELRVGTIIEAVDFPEARNPAFKLKVDFGDEIGIRKSSAQNTDLYTKEDLEGKQVLAVVNFPPKQIGPMSSNVWSLVYTEKMVLWYWRCQTGALKTVPSWGSNRV
ncbi:tRNA-binding protein [Litoribacillus peritrichatus]|uniref:tRNA-binding domain-containing protein n=1 Tax=Litoribacillus peritrichatus TaxID=718191 RepID=A0ABP7M6J4_9GAMM